MGLEQGLAGVVQSWPHHLIDELLLQLLGRLLLPSELWLIRFWFFLSGRGDSNSSTHEGISKPAAANDRWHSRTAWKHGTRLSAKPATMNPAMCGWRCPIMRRKSAQLDLCAATWTRTALARPRPLLRARGWRTRGRLEELFASQGSGANMTKHNHRGGQQTLAFVLVALISNRNWLLWKQTSRGDGTPPVGHLPTGSSGKESAVLGICFQESRRRKQAARWNSQNLQPLLLNWKQKFTSPHHSVRFHAILVQSISLKHCIAFACSELFFLISSLSARIVMPNSRRWQQSGARRGWKVYEELQQQAWFRVLQGRRPVCSVAASPCPAARAFCGSCFEASASPVSSCEPDAGSVRGKFEGGQDRAVHDSPRPQDPAKQAEDCQAYCTRAARRLEKARAAVVAGQGTVVRFEAELQEGLQRLEDLKAAAVPTNRPPVDLAPTMSGEQAEEVKLLRTAVMELTRERDSLRSRVPPTAPVDDPSNILAVVPVQPGGSSGVMGTLINEADSDLRRMQGRFTPY